MLDSKEKLKEYINRETDFFPYKMLIYLPFDLFESQIIAKYLVLLRKTEYHVNVGHKIRGLYYLFRLKKKQCKYGVHIPINVFGIGLSIAHLGTIVVNGNAIVGEGCRIHVGAVIGANGENNRGGYRCLEIMYILDQVQKYLERYKLQMDAR
ncbi:hypothetical protein [Coprococcus sp. LG101-27]|uniref:hypothetical protein n=1 Tax=Coprococcus sp. LG101-27 TaxID=2997954 RepID=UPI0022E6F484|nr:hypothetical protein [Coprococcus sp. LG101-27]